MTADRPAPPPIEDFLRSTSATAASLSADGELLAYLANLTGVMHVYVVPVAGGGGPRQVTDGTDRVSSATFSPSDPDLLIFGRDAGGNENHQLHALRLSTGAVEPLTDSPEAMQTLGGWTRDGRLIALSTNRRNGTDFDIVVRELTTGRERTVWDRGGYCSAAGFSPDGSRLVISHSSSNVNNDLHLLDLGGRTEDGWWTSGAALPTRHLTPHDGDASFGTPRWVDDRHLLLTSDQDADVASLRRLDLEAGVWTELLASRWEVNELALTWDGELLALTVNADGYDRLSLHRVTPGGLERLPDPELPAGQLAGLFWSRKGDTLALTAYGATRGMNAWAWSTRGGPARQLSDAGLAVDERLLVKPELVRFDSFDGLSVPVFVYRPAAASGPSTAPSPVVIEIHGGPEGQSRPSFNPLVQFLAAHGYTVLSPNVRGSAGYGKAYLALDDRTLRLDSVADLAALHAWIRSRPELDAGRVGLYGGSYGGYMVLAGLAFYPHLWAAGVDVVGIANLETFLENTSSYRRAMRECEYGYLVTDREFLRAASPLHRVADMTAPLLIIHGANDPRVPLSEAEQMHAALQSRGIPVQLLVYADEGHGLAKLANRLDAYPRVAAFLDRTLRT